MSQLVQGFFGFQPPRHKHGVGFRPVPPIPATGWTRPAYFPDLSAARMIAFDVETKDPELTEHGPGWGRGRGHIVGVSIGTDDGWRAYFPMRHEIEAENNFKPEDVLAWLRVELGRENQPKVGANLLYDVGWLQHEGVEVKGELCDVQFAEALLEERGQVNLDFLGEKYLGLGKTTNALYYWLSDAYGLPPDSVKIRRDIYRAPPSLVGHYAESDVDLPLRILPLQGARMTAEGLTDLFRMECATIPLLVAMRAAAVSVDVPATQDLRETLLARETFLEDLVSNHYGFRLNVDSAADLARAFDLENLAYGRTAKGAPSFTKVFLENMEHPLAEFICELRQLKKMRGTFLESYILGGHVDSKLYCQFHPLRADGGGTRSGRYSSSDPNLQNIPSRADIAAAIRGKFIPDVGHKQWRKFDYSQIEYRVLAHHATGPGADELRAEYNANPFTDYHARTHGLVERMTGLDIPRKPIKTINFGALYGMGETKLTNSLGLTEEDGAALLAGYHEAAPYAKHTMQTCADEVEINGFVSTILGRRSRFDLWEPKKWHEDPEDRKPLPHWKALQEYGHSIKRSGLHKALNRKLQGGAADMMKLAMLKAWQDGIFDATGVPRLTVHDELDFSDPGTAAAHEGFRALRDCMENAMQLRVPIIADEERGPNWSSVEEVCRKCDQVESACNC